MSTKDLLLQKIERFVQSDNFMDQVRTASDENGRAKRPIVHSNLHRNDVLNGMRRIHASKNVCIAFLAFKALVATFGVTLGRR